jgi:hypothetical protein
MSETTQDTDAHLRFDPVDFGRRVREFARDAHRILKGPDCHADDLIVLHRRTWLLLREAPGSQSSAIGRWLLAARQEIAARLQSWSAQEQDSLVA